MKKWFYALLSKLYAKKYGFCTCNHLCAFCVYKDDCANAYRELKAGAPLYTPKITYISGQPESTKKHN